MKTNQEIFHSTRRKKKTPYKNKHLIKPHQTFVDNKHPFIFHSSLHESRRRTSKLFQQNVFHLDNIIYPIYLPRDIKRCIISHQAFQVRR